MRVINAGPALGPLNRRELIKLMGEIVAGTRHGIDADDKDVRFANGQKDEEVACV